MNVKNIKFLPQKFKYVKLQSLCKVICKLQFCRTIMQLNHSISHMFPNEMESSLNVFASTMRDGIFSKTYDRFVANLQC